MDTLTYFTVRSCCSFSALTSLILGEQTGRGKKNRKLLKGPIRTHFNRLLIQAGISLEVVLGLHKFLGLGPAAVASHCHEAFRFGVLVSPFSLFLVLLSGSLMSGKQLACKLPQIDWSVKSNEPPMNHGIIFWCFFVRFPLLRKQFADESVFN